MGQIKSREPVKLIVGFIFREEPILRKAIGILEKKFGKIDFESRAISFKYTGYYEKELGDSLSRKFASFSGLTLPENLAKIKTLTNRIEKKLSAKGSRRINIDPGYLNLSKLVLASTKDFSHRIYLNRGIYSEITLMFRDKTFQSLDWTYPDYRTPEYIDIFNKIREIYSQQIKKCIRPT